MTASAVRVTVMVVCVIAIAGMIVTQIAGNNGASIAFGIGAAAAVLCSIVATAVAGPPRAGAVDEDQAARVEDKVAELVADGADERAVRDLVRAAVRLGRSSGGA